MAKKKKSKRKASYRPLGILDWSKSDSELGRIHGRSRERIRQLRRKAGLPPSPRAAQYQHLKPYEDVLAYIKANKVVAQSLTAVELAQKLNTARNRVDMAMKHLGLKRIVNKPRSIFHEMNYDLPSSVLERIWGIEPAPTQKHGQRVSMARKRLGKQAAKWDTRIPEQRDSDTLQAAIAREEVHARLYKELKG